MSYYDSTARKLNVSEEHITVAIPEKQKAEPVRLQVVKRRKSSQSTALISFRGVITFVIIVACVSFVLHNQVKVNEINRKIYSANKQIVQLESEYVKMRSSLETTMSIRNVTRQAEQELNMHRVNQSQVIDLRIYEDDKVEIAKKEHPEGISDAIETTAASIVAHIKSLFSSTE